MIEPINCALCGTEVWPFVEEYVGIRHCELSADGHWVNPPDDPAYIKRITQLGPEDEIAGSGSWPRYKLHQLSCPSLVERRNFASAAKEQWEALEPLPNPIETERTTGWRWWKR